MEKLIKYNIYVQYYNKSIFLKKKKKKKKIIFDQTSVSIPKMCFSFLRKHEIILSNIPSLYLLVQSQQWKQWKNL